MKKIILLTFLFSSVIYAQNITNSSKNISKKNDALLKELVVKHKTMGVVAGISQDDTILWKSAYGYMDFKNNKNANTEMSTRIASIAKPMTAIAVMQLYEKDIIKLDEPIQTYISEFPNLSTNKITVRHLLSHTSGIKGYASAKESETRKNYSTLTEAMNVFINRSIISEPGTAYNYTTYGYVILGVLIERVTGERFEDYMQKHIWDKAGMNHTGIEKHDKIYENKTQLYSKRKKGKVKHIKKPNNLSNRIPGGGFYATLDDMLKFGQAVLNNTFIKPETLTQMFQDNGLKKEGNPNGLGWFMYGGKPNPEKVFGHSGGQAGASSQLLIIPSEQKVVVVLCNTSGVWEHTIGAAVKIFKNYKENE